MLVVGVVFLLSLPVKAPDHHNVIIHEMDDEVPIVVKVTSVLNGEATDIEEVERQLETTCLKLNETEINIRLFKRMIGSGVATNDVRCFVEKQALLKTVDHRVNLGLLSRAMKSKLADACALAHTLRKEKFELCNLLKTEFKYSKKKCRRIIKDIMERAAIHRLKHKKKTDKKFILCEKKSVGGRKIGDFRDIPASAWQILEGVNLFMDENITQEDRAVEKYH